MFKQFMVNLVVNLKNRYRVLESLESFGQAAFLLLLI